MIMLLLLLLMLLRHLLQLTSRWIWEMITLLLMLLRHLLQLTSIWSRQFVLLLGLILALTVFITRFTQEFQTIRSIIQLTKRFFKFLDYPVLLNSHVVN
jgi:hypothetical protein